MKKLVFCCLVAAAVVPIAYAQSASDGTLKPVDAFSSIRDPRARAAALFQEAGKVIESPRCLNCHPRGDRPLQGDAMQLHQPLVVRGKDGHGAVAMACSTCHGTSNFTASSTVTVPGAPDWHLAPVSMTWQGRSLKQICQQLKDPKRNGGKTLAQIVEHMGHDPLVGWAWNPGGTRTPAPGTQQQLGALMQAWVDAGAHCPS